MGRAATEKPWVYSDKLPVWFRGLGVQDAVPVAGVRPRWRLRVTVSWGPWKAVLASPHPLGSLLCHKLS